MQRSRFPNVEKIIPKTLYWIDDRRPTYLRRSNYSRPDWVGSGDEIPSTNVPVVEDTVRAPRPVPIPHGESTSRQRKYLLFSTISHFLVILVDL